MAIADSIKGTQMADKPAADAVKKFSTDSGRNLGKVFRDAQTEMLNDPNLQNLEWPLAETAITLDIKQRIGGNLFSYARDLMGKYAK
ncbi:MAG: hypothetical protein JNN08_27485 [Bryobacterales bacterium]|nr:hypothetical protein [Bryobacterales bacterium]